ncbi:MAG: hypothetical protein GC193_04525 [Cryomorphaceae bacterium]|nr:hypothetical protein [Cryomorphaceae bacterium]
MNTLTRIKALFLLVGLVVSILPHELWHSHEHQVTHCDHHHHVVASETDVPQGLIIEIDESHDCSLCDYLQSISFHYLEYKSIRGTTEDNSSIFHEFYLYFETSEKSLAHTGRGPPVI